MSHKQYIKIYFLKFNIQFLIKLYIDIPYLIKMTTIHLLKYKIR